MTKKENHPPDFLDADLPTIGARSISYRSVKIRRDRSLYPIESIDKTMVMRKTAVRLLESPEGELSDWTNHFLSCDSRILCRPNIPMMHIRSLSHKRHFLSQMCQFHDMV